MPMLTGGKMVVDSLRAEGTRDVFGLIGSAGMEIFDALYDGNDVRFISVRDERTGVFGIGIECDAPRHELLRRARAREIWRPAVLARAIPMVHRVASYGWYHRPEQERMRLRAAIQTALSGGLK